MIRLSLENDKPVTKAGQTHLNWDATIAREGAGRTPFLSAKGREGARRKPFFVHGGPRRGTENILDPSCPRRGRENRAIASKFGRHNSPRRAPTRGAPTDSGRLTWVCPNLMQLPWLLRGVCLNCDLGGLGGWAVICAAATLGAEMGRMKWAAGTGPIVFSRRFARRRAATRGGPLPSVFSRRFARRRAPTRGAPTCCLLSAFCLVKGTHKGCPYSF